jgi:ribonuclease HII
MQDVFIKEDYQQTNLFFEKRLWRAGIIHVCGVDEVGRGSLAGPVLACAVIFKKDYFHSEVSDSKLLSSRKRNILEQVLIREAIEWKIGLATVKEIDYLNIRQATFLAMRRALNALKKLPDYVLVDGENLPKGNCPSSGIIKGDQKSFSIAAASIIAKQRRDALMIEKSEIYPAYRFEKNKGYGTQEHIKAIVSEGETSFHRKTFLKKLIGKY